MKQLADTAFNTNGLRLIDDEGRDQVRGSEDLAELLAFKLLLLDKANGRGLWGPSLVLTALAASSFSVAIFLVDSIGAARVLLLLVAAGLTLTAGIVSWDQRLRAKAADTWLVEVDFRLAQLAARA